jgi:ribonuclease VapC
MPTYVFDSHALLAFFQGEPDAETVEKILRQSHAESSNVFISLINLGEIIYLTKRRFGDEKKIELLSRIYQLGFKIIPVSDALVFQAAEIKAEYTLSYADCFALACAIDHSAILVTGDPEFKSVEHLVSIAWIEK